MISPDFSPPFHREASSVTGFSQSLVTSLLRRKITCCILPSLRAQTLEAFREFRKRRKPDRAEQAMQATISDCASGRGREEQVLFERKDADSVKRFAVPGRLEGRTWRRQRRRERQRRPDKQMAFAGYLKFALRSFRHGLSHSRAALSQRGTLPRRMCAAPAIQEVCKQRGRVAGLAALLIFPPRDRLPTLPATWALCPAAFVFLSRGEEKT